VFWNYQTSQFINQYGRLRLKCDGTRAETRFHLSPKQTSPFKSAGASVQSTDGNWCVRISVSNAGYTTFQGSVRVLATHSICQFPLHFPSHTSPCAIRFHMHSNIQEGMNLHEHQCENLKSCITNDSSVYVALAINDPFPYVQNNLTLSEHTSYWERSTISKYTLHLIHLHIQVKTCLFTVWIFTNFKATRLQCQGLSSQDSLKPYIFHYKYSKIPLIWLAQDQKGARPLDIPDYRATL
jgi:hypothetical protein